MNAKANEMAERLKRFATRVVKFARAMPKDGSLEAIARQLTKSGRAKPPVSMRVIAGAHIVTSANGRQELDWLSDQSRQLRAILVASVRTARANRKSSNKSSNP